MEGKAMKKILVLMCFVFNLQAVDLSILKEYERENGDTSYAFWSFLHSCKYRPNLANNCDKKDEIIKHFKDECENGDGRSCAAIGKVYSDELIQSDDKVRDSINYYKKSCDLDVRASCAIVGLKYHHIFSNITDKNEKQVLLKNIKKYYKKACDMGLAISCKDLEFIKKEEKQEKNAKYYYIALFIALIIIIRMYFKSKDRYI